MPYTGNRILCYNTDLYLDVGSPDSVHLKVYDYGSCHRVPYVGACARGKPYAQCYKYHCIGRYLRTVTLEVKVPLNVDTLDNIFGTIPLSTFSYRYS